MFAFFTSEPDTIEVWDTVTDEVTLLCPTDDGFDCGSEALIL